jgi:hypothetical protein
MAVKPMKRRKVIFYLLLDTLLALRPKRVVGVAYWNIPLRLVQLQLFRSLLVTMSRLQVAAPLMGLHGSLLVDPRPVVIIARTRHDRRRLATQRRGGSSAQKYY